MSVTFGFYNSLNHDRTYDAIQMSSIFDGIIKDGIFESIGDQLEVSANSGMVITVGTGRAWFDHTWTLNDSLLPLTVPDAEVVLDRIDSVILEVNADVMTRANSIYILSGTPSSSPVHPDLINTEDVHQYRLADIAVGAGVTEITQAEITNYIGTTDTPFITGILETMNVDMLVAQWQSEYQQMKNADHIQYQSSLNADHTAYETQRQADDALFNAWFQNKMNEVIAWYNNLQVTIDQNVAVRLQNEIGTLSLLQTETKANLVEAINELVGTSYPCFIRVTCAEEFAGNTVTLSYGGSVVKSAVIPITAPYVVEFAVKETGQYTIRETVYDISTTVNVTNYTIYNAGLYLGSIALTVDADFIGSVITCTDGSTTKTWLCDGLTHVFSVGLGTWTISGTVDGQTYETSVTVTEYREYSAELHTISAFNYIEWLESAGIDPSGHSSLDDVLADEAALRVLFTLHASVDYLSDSATGAALDDIETIVNNDYCAKWINAKDYALDTLYANESIAALMDTADKYFYGEWTKLEPHELVPKMTSNTTPSGEAFASENRSSTEAYKAFDDNSSTYWYASIGQGSHIGYAFPSAKVVKKVYAKCGGSTSGSSYPFKVQGSNNGTDWIDLSDQEAFTSSVRELEIELNNNTAYTRYRLAFVANSYIGEFDMLTLQFYGYKQGESEWGPVGAVPKMTSNTTPEGEAFCSNQYSDYDPWKAFDKNVGENRVGWYTLSPANQSLGYRFEKPIRIKRLEFANFNSGGAYVGPATAKVQVSNDNTNWIDVGDTLECGFQDFNMHSFDVDSENYYRYARIVNLTSISASETGIGELQFYGRQLDVSVPKMTSNTEPSGECFGDSLQPAYYAFDNNVNGYGAYTDSWNKTLVGYNFKNNVVVKCVSIYGRLQGFSATQNNYRLRLEGSNDGTIYTEITDDILVSKNSSWETYPIVNNTEYKYYRLVALSGDAAPDTGAGYKVQFHGLDYSESIEYDIYSAAADTVFYYPGGDTSGSPVVLCTTDNTGHGKAIISLEEGTSITLYSTVAKDTETGTNNYSKNISLTNSIHGVYVMPDITYYWYGYKAMMADATKTGDGTVTYNTNTVDLFANANALTGKYTGNLDIVTDANIDLTNVTTIFARYSANRGGNTNDGNISYNNLGLDTRSQAISNAQPNSKIGVRVHATITGYVTGETFYAKDAEDNLLGQIAYSVSFSGKQICGDTVHLHALWLE